VLTSWFYLAVGALYIYLLVGGNARAPEKRALRVPFTWYVVPIFLEAGIGLVRAGNVRSPRDLVLTDYWAAVLEWGAIGVSLILLGNALFGERRAARES
jgi:hypothetical protein